VEGEGCHLPHRTAQLWFGGSDCSPPCSPTLCCTQACAHTWQRCCMPRRSSSGAANAWQLVCHVMASCGNNRVKCSSYLSCSRNEKRKYFSVKYFCCLLPTECDQSDGKILTDLFAFYFSCPCRIEDIILHPTCDKYIKIMTNTFRSLTFHNIYNINLAMLCFTIKT